MDQFYQFYYLSAQVLLSVTGLGFILKAFFEKRRPLMMGFLGLVCMFSSSTMQRLTAVENALTATQEADDDNANGR